jgi:hypothetical protein
MVRRSYFIGDAKSVASDLAAYHEAGVSWLHLSDLLPLAVDLEDGSGPMDRSYEVFRILRGA